MIVTSGLGTNLLITQGYGQTEVIVVIPTGAEATFENVFIELTCQNSYTDFAVTLNKDWHDYLLYTDDPISVYFTVKERWIDALSEALIDKLGTAQAENILFNLSVNDTDIPTRSGYKWQLQVRDVNGTVVRTPIGGELEVKPILRRAV